MNNLHTWRKTPARHARDALPDRSGLYAVLVDNPLSLPSRFRDELRARSKHGLLYIGRGKSLLKRVGSQELRHKGAGTFFRSIGVMLGHVAAVGGRNFRFSELDTAEITDWISTHLSVYWKELPANALSSEEKTLIMEKCPILNKTHNPRSFAHLAELRAISRQV